MEAGSQSRLKVNDCPISYIAACETILVIYGLVTKKGAERLRATTRNFRFMTFI